MILEINYNNGSLKIDLEQVASTKGLTFAGFSQVKFKKLLKAVELANNSEDLAKQIMEHLNAQLRDLPKGSGCSKKIIKLMEITREHFNLEEEKAMTNTYFSSVKTLEELRTVYKNLLKANHPDNGGSEEVTKEINTQYEKAFDALKDGANLEDEKTAIKWNEAEDAAIREALCKIIHLENINIEVVGCWIWVDGDTYAGRDTLKAAGYKWSKSRKKWHFAPYEKKYFKGSKKSFDQIRREYGSTTVNNEKQERITA